MDFNNFLKVLEDVVLKFIALLIVMFIYLAFMLYKVVIPSVLISFFTKLNLIQSMVIYVSFIFAFFIISKLLNRSKENKDATPLEYIID